MEFLFSSWNFIPGYFWTLLGLPFGGSLTRREDKEHILQEESFGIVYQFAAYGGDAFPTSAIEDSFPRRKFIPQSSPLRLTILRHEAVLILYIWCHCASRFENEQCANILLFGETTQKILLSSKALGVPTYRIHSFTVLAGCIFKSIWRNHAKGPGNHREWWGSWEVQVENSNGLSKINRDTIKKPSRNKIFKNSCQTENISKTRVKVYFKDDILLKFVIWKRLKEFCLQQVGHVDWTWRTESAQLQFSHQKDECWKNLAKCTFLFPGLLRKSNNQPTNEQPTELQCCPTMCANNLLKESTAMHMDFFIPVKNIQPWYLHFSFIRMTPKHCVEKKNANVEEIIRLVTRAFPASIFRARYSNSLLSLCCLMLQKKPCVNARGIFFLSSDSFRCHIKKWKA